MKRTVNRLLAMRSKELRLVQATVKLESGGKGPNRASLVVEKKT